MKTKQLCAAFISTLVSIPAFADIGNVYGAAKIGYSWEDLTNVESTSDRWGATVVPDATGANKGAVAFGGAVGYIWNSFLIPVRMEADYTYRNNLEYNTGYHDVLETFTGEIKTTVQSQTILGNIYLDFPIIEMFSLFVGAGGGLAYNAVTSHNTYDDYPESTNTSYFNRGAWMATAGLSVFPTAWLGIDLSYRYSDLGGVRVDTSDYSGMQFTSTDFAAQEVYLAFRFIMPSEKRPVPVPMTYKPKAVVQETQVVPVTKSPAYKPTTKSPAYEPNNKGAEYDKERAQRKKKSGIWNKDK